VVTGGQAEAHAPEQADAFMASFANMYTERPDPSVRNVPADPVWVSIVIAVAAADDAPAPPPYPPPYPPPLPLTGLLLELLLQAAAASSAAASGTPSLTAAGSREANEPLIVIVSCPGRR